ncbi:MAG: ABC transporter substrate-binding protein [Acidobacteriota bacterium]|nr:ABC transporter substrate-binding protein [Acidobacteriota bacterium]
MPRIVSLIAGATEIVAALGQLRNLVGRSHECDFPPEVQALPVCTKPRIDVSADSREIDAQIRGMVAQALSIYDVFDEVLDRLQPTHIITQTQCEVCAVSLRDLQKSIASRLRSEPRIVSLQPNSLEDIWEDFRRVARSLDIDAEPVIAHLRSKMERISEKALASPHRPRVACVEWMEPLMAAGNWTPELVGMAGGVNLFGEPGRHSPWMAWRELVESRPDITIAMPCGFDLARTQEEIHWLTRNPAFADLTGKLYLADGNQFFNRSGPRVVEALEILAEITHPEIFTADRRGTGWKILEGEFAEDGSTL